MAQAALRAFGQVGVRDSVVWGIETKESRECVCRSETGAWVSVTAVAFVAPSRTATAGGERRHAVSDL